MTEILSMSLAEWAMAAPSLLAPVLAVGLLAFYFLRIAPKEKG